MLLPKHEYIVELVDDFVCFGSCDDDNDHEYYEYYEYAAIVADVPIVSGKFPSRQTVAIVIIITSYYDAGELQPLTGRQ